MQTGPRQFARQGLVHDPLVVPLPHAVLGETGGEAQSGLEARSLAARAIVAEQWLDLCPFGSQLLEFGP